MDFQTPYYLIDERKLLRNLKKIEYVRKVSGAKSLLALKCFATWGVFPLMRKYMDGTTSSSLFETKLGYRKFGKETHAYSVAWADEDIPEIRKIADKVIFNSVSQLKRYAHRFKGIPVGLRVNPGFSYSHFDLADPARKCSKLGATDLKSVLAVAPMISGAMFHYNCENDDFPSFSKQLDRIARDYAPLLEKLQWVSLGGGLYFTKEGYPLEKFARKLKAFSELFGVQVYLEPGESSITRSAELVVKVLDIVHNGGDVAVVDSSVEAHMLDLLIYRQNAKVAPDRGKHRYQIAGKSCLAGDVFGRYAFPKLLKVGDRIRFQDAAGYTMVKKNWFNGLQMPSIIVKRLNGKYEIVRKFGYNDFEDNLS
jgi:carboxynorspermidine decarboxylase